MTTLLQARIGLSTAKQLAELARLDEPTGAHMVQPHA